MADNFGIGTPSGSFMASLMPSSSPIQMPLYIEGDGGGDGQAGGGGGDPKGAGGEGDPQNQQDPPGGGKAPVAGAKDEGGKGGDKTYSFKEDRTDWTPRTRLNEESAKFKRSQEEVTGLKSELEKEQARVRAALGIDKPDPKAAETEELRGILHEMFPQLKAMEGLTVDELAELREAADVSRSTVRANWDRFNSETFVTLEKEVAEGMGIEKLSERQSQSVKRAYREEAYASVAVRPRDERGNPQADPTGNDFLSRHERGDKTLITEFVKNFLDDWYEPARKSVNVDAMRRSRRPVPQGGRTRQSIVQGAPQIDYNNDTEFKKALIDARATSQ